MNPFLRPLTSRKPMSSPSVQSSVSNVGNASVLSTRAQKLQAIVADVHARTARIEYLRAIGHFAQEELKNAKHTGSSRLTWLSQQLKKMDK